MSERITSIRRGELYYATLDGIGNEQTGTRPVLIIQNDVANLVSTTCIVTIATSVYKKPNQPTHVLLDNIDGLSGESMFLTEYIRTVDKRRLLRFIGKLNDEQMSKIDDALRVSISLNYENPFLFEAEAP